MFELITNIVNLTDHIHVTCNNRKCKVINCNQSTYSDWLCLLGHFFVLCLLRLSTPRVLSDLKLWYIDINLNSSLIFMCIILHTVLSFEPFAAISSYPELCFLVIKINTQNKQKPCLFIHFRIPYRWVLLLQWPSPGTTPPTHPSKPSKQTVKAKTNRQNKTDHTKQTKPHTPDTYSPILYYRTRQDLWCSTLYFIR